MATTSGDISTLVFKRNISLTAGDYVLDFQMLRVLDEIEGTRNLAAIAARMGTDITDVRTTCARLFKQGLIMPARSLTPPPLESNRDFSSPAPETDPTEKIADPAPDYAHEIRIDEQAGPAGVLDGLPLDQVETPILERASAPADPGGEEDRGQTEEAALFWGDTKESFKAQAWDWPDRPLAALDSENGDSSGSPAGSTGFSENGEYEPVPTSASEPTNGSTDIFNILRTKDRDAVHVSSEAFFATSGSKPAGSDSRIPFTAAQQTDESVSEETPHSQEEIEAIEHFEEGLVLLRRGAFKEALHRFEMALDLDPENRLCRANIQRIQEKLASDEE